MADRNVEDATILTDSSFHQCKVMIMCLSTSVRRQIYKTLTE